MTETKTIAALRLLQAADSFRAGLAGEFSAVHGISVNEFLMMRHLERAPRHRLSRVDLAKRMHISASTVTRMAAPMEKIGFVARDVDVRDARVTYVVLTEAGQARLEEALATFAKRAGYLFGDGWAAQDIDGMSEMLRRASPGAEGTLT